MVKTDSTRHLSLDIIYQDNQLVVVNKPGGLLSVPGRGPDKQDCVVNRLISIFPDLIPQPAVHRLDMDTSGLMLLARNAESHRKLSKAFEERQVHKKYIAVVEGVVQKDKGEIRLAFCLDAQNRPYQIFDPVNGKMGITFWEKIAVEGFYTRIAFTPLTGRTHQLRLHAAHPLGLGFPIVGDRLYGKSQPGISLKLHATFLRFIHPNIEKTVTCEIPPSF